MGGTMEDFCHLIEIDEGVRSLRIYRVRGAERELYTSVKLPLITWDNNPEGIAEFCRPLGENIVFDSPQARNLPGI